MAARKSAAATKTAATPTTNGHTESASVVAGLDFVPAEAPAIKAGPGRKPNAEMLVLCDKLATLPVEENPSDSRENWFAVSVPDVSAFTDLVRQAGNRLGCSFQVRHDVKITDDDELNPGVVNIRRIPRRVRGPRKPKSV